MRGWDRRSWGGTTNEKWLWAFPIIFPLAVIVLLPVALVFNLLAIVTGYRPKWWVW